MDGGERARLMLGQKRKRKKIEEEFKEAEKEEV